MKVGVLTTRLFGQPANGGERCTARLLAALQEQGHDVAVLGSGNAAPPPGWSPARWNSVGPDVPPFAEWPRVAQARHLARAVLTGQASTLLRLAPTAACLRAAAVLRSWQVWGVEALVVDHLQAWHWLAPGLVLPAPVLVMHNLESQGYAAQARQVDAWRAHVLRREARLLARLEARAARDSAAVLVLSEADAQAWRGQLGHRGGEPAVLPGYPSSCAAPRPAVPGRRRVGVIGTWTWQPNRDALHWLLHAVAPHLPAGTELWVAGRGVPPQWPGAVARGVRVLGPVPCAEAFLRDVDVLALPSLHGSGVQEKAIEALASGLPVVATPHALRGLGPALPPQARVAEAPEAFARLCAEPLAACAVQTAATAAWATERRRDYHLRLADALQASRAAPPWRA